MLAAECGYTFEYIDRQMTIPRLVALNKYWDMVPPLGASVYGIARALGVGAEKEARKAQEAGENIGEAKQMAAVLNAGANANG